jgi:hypothetical protein
MQLTSHFVRSFVLDFLPLSLHFRLEYLVQ